MGVVFDCFWWWRAEFGGQINPYPDEGDVMQDDDQMISDLDYAANSLNNGIVSDWQWAAGMIFPMDNGLDLGGGPSANGEYLLPL